jgi:hypothetical protein
MRTLLTTALLSLSLILSTQAADKENHEHHHGIKAGPTGGRLITEVEPHLEFFVNKENKVEIRFISDDMKVLAPADQVISIVMGDRSSPTKLSFSKDGNKLVSDKVIPEGNNHPTVLQIKTTPSAKTINEKFNLNLLQCPTCSNKEYACICDH